MHGFVAQHSPAAKRAGVPKTVRPTGSGLAFARVAGNGYCPAIGPGQSGEVAVNDTIVTGLGEAVQVGRHQADPS